MNIYTTYYAAEIFQRQLAGVPMLKRDRAFLQDLLASMEAPERAGSIAKIIEIMLEG